VPFVQGSLRKYKLHNFKNKDAYGLPAGKSESTSNLKRRPHIPPKSFKDSCQLQAAKCHNPEGYNM